MKKAAAEKKVLKSLLDISSFTSFVENPDLILSLIIEECVLLTRGQWGIVLSYDKNLDLDTYQLTKVINPEEKSRISADLDKEIKGIISKNGQMGVLEEALWNKKEVQKTLKESISSNVKGLLLCPIKKKEQFLGLAIVVDKKEGGSFTKKDMENFSIICQEASIVIENINLFKAKLQSERMAAIGQTIAGISHYVKNILQGISAGSFLLNTGIEDKNMKSIIDSWGIVDKNTKRISDLVMDMLQYSKERKPEKQKTQPSALIKDVAELMASKLKERNIKLELSIKELPSSMMMNEKGIHRSLLNIIGNAIDACDKPDSLIRLEAMFEEASQVLKIIISDNGKGVPEEDLSKIFQPFYSKKKDKGTGLGMAITRKVLEEHDGSIKVKSELGKGTVFEISIPLVKTA